MIDNWHRGEAGFFLERGEVLEQAGRLDEAMSEFKRAVRADPGLVEAHMALGFHYRRKNLLSKAAEEFRTATSLAPSYDSYFNLGHVLVDLGQPREAISAFQQCLALVPGDPAAGYEIAYALYSSGDYAAALAQVGPLVDAYPDDWELRYLMGSCQLGLGHYAAAQASLERAAELLPAGEEGEGLQQAIEIAERYQEFERLEPWDVKARLYAEHGIACLGTSTDDGLSFPAFERDRLSFQDLGRILQRFHALRLRWRWRFDAVVPVDDTSAPLALALSHSLRAPMMRPEEAPRGGFVLIVWAAVSVPELLNVVAERVGAHYIAFVGVFDEAALDRTLPDIIGVVCRGTVALPWDSGLEHQGIAAAAHEIVSAVKTLPPDGTLADQIRYYSRQHRRLRFFPSQGEPR